MPARLGAIDRTLAFLFALGSLAVLIVGANLHADPAGHGTHTQLGLTPCGWLLATGHPCPTCGMTTAFTHACHGHFFAAMYTQPMGAVLAVASAIGFWISLHAGMTGSRFTLTVAKLLRPKGLWLIAGAWAASWVYVLLTWKYQ